MKTPLLPGSTIGIFGGGQLGRMMAIAGHKLGYKICIVDPDPQCPARSVAEEYVRGSWSDSESAADLARSCDVITLEIEQVAVESLSTARRFAPVRPSLHVMEIIRSRLTQKQWLQSHGVPLGPWFAVHTWEQLREAAVEHKAGMYVKSAIGGYDGKNQSHLIHPSPADLEAAWSALGSQPCIAEQAVDIRCEISVLVARSPLGQVAVYPPALNHHHKQILAWSSLPSALPADIEDKARSIAQKIAHDIELEGILAVEMFVTADEEVLVNELAPRPHNSYHASMRACITDQFEQAIRAVCGLPLGDPAVTKPAAIVNLLGDLWLNREPNFERALAFESVHLHLYGKSEPRPGRKMGHLSAVGETGKQALDRVLQAFHAL